MILLAGTTMLLTSCEYPYYYNNGYYGAGVNQRSGTVYGVLGGLAGNSVLANRDRFYSVRRDSVFGGRYHTGRPLFYSSSFQPCYRPPYRYSPFSSGYNYHPWGGYFGRSYPYSGWGTSGLGFGTRWF